MTTLPTTGPGSDYKLPSVGEMIKYHTLSHHIMHSKDPDTNDNAIFDDQCLGLLRRFIDDPSQKNTMLRDMGMPEVIEDPLIAADKHRNLVGFIVARHGTEEKIDPKSGEVVGGTGPVFTIDEIEEMRKWYANRSD